MAPLGEARHIFTHIEWQMTGFEVILPEGAAAKLDTCAPFLPEDLFFANREELEQRFALPSAYRAYRAFI